MVELVDTPDLGSGAARRGSSSLSTRTRLMKSRGSNGAMRRGRPEQGRRTTRGQADERYQTVSEISVQRPQNGGFADAGPEQMKV